MSVIPVDPEQLSKFIDKSKIFDTTRQLMIGYLTNWYNDDAETFVENMWADLSTVLEHYQFRNEFVSITKNSTLTHLWTPFPVPSASPMKKVIVALGTMQSLTFN